MKFKNRASVIKKTESKLKTKKIFSWISTEKKQSLKGEINGILTARETRGRKYILKAMGQQKCVNI